MTSFVIGKERGNINTYTKVAITTINFPNKNQNRIEVGFLFQNYYMKYLVFFWWGYLDVFKI